MPMTCEQIVRELRAHASPANVAGMARYGIRSANALGLTAPELEALARRAGRGHALASALWDTGIYEARILAAMVDEPAAVSEAQMEDWAGAFDSWAMCDGVCNRLFVRAPLAWQKAVEWTGRDEEYVKRAGFVLMAQLAVHDKRAPDARFLVLLPHLVTHAGDDRPYVRKAVNWALRQIGKRSLPLNRAAVRTARTIQRGGSSSGRWIASDALRELTSEATRARLARRRQVRSGRIPGAAPRGRT